MSGPCVRLKRPGHLGGDREHELPSGSAAHLEEAFAVPVELDLQKLPDFWIAVGIDHLRIEPLKDALPAEDLGNAAPHLGVLVIERELRVELLRVSDPFVGHILPVPERKTPSVPPLDGRAARRVKPSPVVHPNL
jgi:hypothetical protein